MQAVSTPLLFDKFKEVMADAVVEERETKEKVKVTEKSKSPKKSRKKQSLNYHR